MAVEAATRINDLDITKPDATDSKREGDDHLRLIKKVLKQTFTNVDAALSVAFSVLNGLPARIASLESSGFVRKDGTVEMTGELRMGAKRIRAMAAPQSSGDAATWDYVNLKVQLPVGSIYLNATNGTNPASLLGYGTWERLGQGRVLVGEGTGTDDNGTAWNFAQGETGGEYTHALTTDELPAHTHADGDYNVILKADGTGTPDGTDNTSGEVKVNAYGTLQSVGGGEAHTNMPPYLAVYIWVRTA